MPREFNVLALVKGAERYVFVYDDAGGAAVLDALRDLAAHPELSFTWFDAAVLGDRVREQTEAVPAPAPFRSRV